MLTLKVIQMSNSSSPSPYPETPTDLPLPEMIGSSEILSDNHRRYVSTTAKLPRAAQKKAIAVSIFVPS